MPEGQPRPVLSALWDLGPKASVWAKENNVTDASECGGSSQPFIDGCETYAEALEERAYDDDDSYDREYDGGY